MNKWKLQIRNKIEDSKIEEPVKALSQSGDEKICGLAKQLIEYWSTLELSYKIPRVSKIASVSSLKGSEMEITDADFSLMPMMKRVHRPLLKPMSYLQPVVLTLGRTLKKSKSILLPSVPALCPSHVLALLLHHHLSLSRNLRSIP